MPTHIERVVALGDSLTLGLGTPNKHGWVQMLHDDYNQLNADLGEATRHPRIFYELGIFAAKATQLLTMAEQEAPLRFWLPEEKEDVYDASKRLSVVTIGTNDAWVRPETAQPVTPIADFTRRMGSVAASLARQGEVLFVGLFPSDPELNGKFWDKPALPQQESKLAYEAAAIEQFRKVGAHVIPLAQRAFESPEFMNNFTVDGAHGNTQNEQWVYDTVSPTFRKILANTTAE